MTQQTATKIPAIPTRLTRMAKAFQRRYQMAAIYVGFAGIILALLDAFIAPRISHDLFSSPFAFLRAPAIAFGGIVFIAKGVSGMIPRG